jgi:CheY-like chemotaxis protein
MLVLIVDDEPLVAQTLGLIFRKSGYNTEVVHTAEDAMSFVRKTPPNLVLCDIEMPIRDGLELGEELPQCPILVLTGSYRSLSKVRARAGSLNQEVTVMVKPCQPLDLLATAGNLLKSA